MADNISEAERIENFLSDKQTHEENLTLEFASQLLTYQLQKKEIDSLIKTMKADAKADGILVGNILKALKKLKEDLSKDELTKTEEDFLTTVFSENHEITEKMKRLIEKD